MGNIVSNKIPNSGICSWLSIYPTIYQFLIASISFCVFFRSGQNADDPDMHIYIENIRTYSMEHLQNWLFYRGDTLKGTANLTDAQVKVL